MKLDEIDKDQNNCNDKYEFVIHLQLPPNRNKIEAVVQLMEGYISESEPGKIIYESPHVFVERDGENHGYGRWSFQVPPKTMVAIADFSNLFMRTEYWLDGKPATKKEVENEIWPQSKKVI